jgi:hypothetical protein
MEIEKSIMYINEMLNDNVDDIKNINYASECIKRNNANKQKNKYIMTIYNNQKKLLRFEYKILGSFSKKYNIFLWSIRSETHDKSMIDDVYIMIKDLIKKYNSGELSNINDNYNDNDVALLHLLLTNHDTQTVLSIDHIVKVMKIIEIIYGKHIIFVDLNESITHMIMIESILFNQLF